MQGFRQGIYLQQYAQTNPLELYQSEGYERFKRLNAKMNEEIYELFFSAINKTAQNTESMKFELKNSYYPNKNDSNKVMMVSAANSQNNAKLAKLFDCILNTHEYFRYVNKLYWVYDNMVTNLIRIDVKLLPKDVPTNSQYVFFYDTGSRDSSGNASRINATVSDLSEDCKKSFKKYYDSYGEKNLRRLVPELKDPENLSEIDISDCASVSGNYILKTGGKITEGGMIGNWNANKAANWLACASKDSSQQICAFAVQQAVIAGGIECVGGNGYRKALNLEKTGNWVFVANGKTNKATIDNFKPQVGDIIGMTRGSDTSQYGHVCMYCGQQYGWISDYKQYDRPYPYSSKGTGEYWIIRYIGGAKTTTATPLRCYGGKCLNNCSV